MFSVGSNRGLLLFLNGVAMRPINKADNRVKSVWYRMNNKNIEVNKNNIRKSAIESGVTISDISEESMGLNSITKCYVFCFNGTKYLFPEKKICELVGDKETSVLERNNSFWEKVDWFFPPFVPMGEVEEAFELVDIKIGQIPALSNRDLKSKVNRALKIIYNLSFISRSIECVFRESFSIKEHVPLIKESVIAFYAGYSSLSIAALIPIVEDILFKISGGKNENLGIQGKKDIAIKKAKNYVKSEFFNGVDWYPKEYDNEDFLLSYDERYRLINSIDLWLSNSFYADTKAYAAGERFSGFNRHAFAHASNKLWKDEANFFRAIGLMQALAFVEVFSGEKSKVSIFPPRENQQSRDLYNKAVTAFYMHRLLRKLCG